MTTTRTAEQKVEALEEFIGDMYQKLGDFLIDAQYDEEGAKKANALLDALSDPWAHIQ